MKKEIWKPIQGFEQHYQISSFGNIKSIDRVVIHSNGFKRIYHGKILNNVVATTGYLKITMSKKGVPKSKYIHVLVGLHFIPNKTKKPCINHINGIKTDNSVNNLECTHSENTKHSYAIGLQLPKSPKTKLFTAKQIIKIRLLNHKMSQLEIGKLYNISQPHVSAIMTNRIYK